MSIFSDLFSSWRDAFKIWAGDPVVHQVGVRLHPEEGEAYTRWSGDSFRNLQRARGHAREWARQIERTSNEIEKAKSSIRHVYILD